MRLLAPPCRSPSDLRAGAKFLDENELPYSVQSVTIMLAGERKWSQGCAWTAGALSHGRARRTACLIVCDYMSDSDTRIGNRESQTGLFRLVPRQPLRVVTGPLAGVRGTFAERRAGGLVLVQVGSGMYVEVPEICLQPEEKT